MQNAERMKAINIDMFETYLDDVVFPASKKAILESASANDAPEELLLILGETGEAGYETRDELKRAINVLIQSYEDTGPR